MPRIIAIDFGTKRVGLAVTDPLQMIAGPLKTVHSSELIDYLKNYFAIEKVESIVIGEPKHLDGTLSGPREALENMIKNLSKTFPDKEIHRVDERFTSKLAMDSLIAGGASKKQRKDKAALDTISAVIILQSFMEQNAFRKH
jgi:putative holliday junction resolvase